MCGVMSFISKLSTVVCILAMLVTIHQLRLNTEDHSAELQQARDDVISSEKSKENALGSLRDIQMKMDLLKKEVASSQSEINKLQSTLSSKAKIEQEVSAKDAQVKDLTQKVHQLEEASRKQQKQFEEQSGSQVKKLQSESGELQKQVSILEGSVKEKDTAIADLKKQQSDSQKQLGDVTSKYSQAEKLKEMLESKAKAQDKKIAELTEQVRLLEEKTKELKQWSKSLL